MNPIDSRDIAPQTLLESLLSDVKSGEIPEPDKCLVVFLYDQDNRYQTMLTNSGMSCSEVVALCELAKNATIRRMDALENED